MRLRSIALVSKGSNLAAALLAHRFEDASFMTCLLFVSVRRPDQKTMFLWS